MLNHDDRPIFKAHSVCTPLQAHSPYPSTVTLKLAPPHFSQNSLPNLVIHFPEQVHVPTVMRPNPLYFHILYHSYIEAGFSHQMSHRNKAKIAPKS